jgi:hypothetical protein
LLDPDNKFEFHTRIAQTSAAAAAAAAGKGPSTTAKLFNARIIITGSSNCAGWLLFANRFDCLKYAVEKERKKNTQ